ncbi:MAG TPA: hypothetical protein VM432_12990 [Bdellovibrionales bacterium]|jgi:hypothetical protein|nr:hypothetical protein [Bdellovibrionales bacterium]
MSKLSLVLVVLSLNSTAFANEIQVGHFPSAIVCSAPKARLAEVRKIEVKDLDTDEPSSTFSDGLQHAGFHKDRYEVSYSDECESWFALSFKISDLLALKSGKKSKISGELTYSELAEMFPGADPNASTVEDAAPVTCKLSK